MESSPSISNNNEGKDISLDSPWHLVSLFCKIHNLHMSLTLLHELGRNNDWIMFLYESQVQECPPQTVLQILHDYFTIETLTTHLKIIIQELVDIKTEEHNTHLTINNNNNSISAENSKTVSKSDFPNNNLLEFVIYNYKIRQTTNTKPNLTNYILDPIYIMNLAENPKEKINKMNLILNESIFFNSKDLIMVSLLFSNFEEDKKFICLSLHLYITIKEIFLSEVKNEGMKTKSKIFMNSIKNLKEIFDNRKKNIKLTDLENIINFLLLNNHSQLLLEALNLFEIYYSFDEFVKFCKCFSDNDFENAFIHLYVFKNSMNIVFQEKYMDDILILIEEEQELHENLGNIKDVHDLILIFFYQVSITVVKNLIELYELDRFKLFKLFEILYLSKWNKKYSYYFKNLCILDNIKGKGKSLNYKSSFNLLVECLIQEKNFNVLSEFIISYEENIEDDTLLYRIVSIIKSFEKNYILYNDEERKQFWDCIENILKESNLHNVSVAKFFFYILETQENKLYIKEQLIIIFKIYSYLSKSSQNLKQNDKLTKFMKNVIGYEIDNNLNENYILQDLQYKIFIIIFSNCKFEKLSKFFNKQEYFEILYIKENFNLLLNGLYEESTAINFNKVSKNFWAKINNESNMTTYSNSSYYDENNSERKLMNFNDSLKISCINLLNLNNQSLSESLCIFYKLEIDQLKKFISYKNFIKDNLSILKRVDFSILINMFQDAISQNYPNNSNISRYLIVKSMENSTCEELDRKLKSCLEYKSIERIVLYELLKLLISSKIELNEERFLSFNNINSEILNQLIECPSQESENLIKYLNKLIDIDDLLAEIIVQKYIENTSKLASDNLSELNYSKSLFKYVRLFRYPSKLGFVIKQRLINQGFIFEQNPINNLSSNENLSDTKKTMTKEVITINNPFNWELIFMGYYSFLSDCHSELINFNNIIHSFTQHYNLNSFNNIFKFFQFFEENERENEIFYCMNKILFKNQIKNYQKINNYDVFSGSKSEIEFYFKSKNFKKLGEIYVKIAKDYSLIIEEKQKENENKVISKKQQELTILNLYIKAAELFLMDNCVLNYSKVLEDINNLINNNFNDEIDINLEK
jgi:hypothetical protein